MIGAGLGREAALAGAFLGDPNILEKSWHDTGMFPEAALHAHVCTFAHSQNFFTAAVEVSISIYVRHFEGR